LLSDFELRPEMNSAASNTSSLKKSEQNSLKVMINTQYLNRQKLLTAVFD